MAKLVKKRVRHNSFAPSGSRVGFGFSRIAAWAPMGSWGHFRNLAGHGSEKAGLVPASRIAAAGGVRPGRALLLLALLLLGLTGCGTSRWSDSARTATEQLLISEAIDRAVSKFNFSALAGKTVYLDDTPIRGTTDAAYLSSTVRQHLLASGAILKENKQDAEYVLELRAGAIGTDRHDVTYGVPSVTLPHVLPGSVGAIPNQLPEIPFAKKTHQRGVAKIAAFAYNRETGRPVWQSGTIPVETDIRALWVLGAGPFVKSRTGSRVLLAGDPVPLPPVHLLLDELLPGSSQPAKSPSVTQEAFFVDRPQATSIPAEDAAQGSAPADSPGTANPSTAAASAGAGNEPPDAQVAQKTPEQSGESGLSQSPPAGPAPPGSPGSASPPDIKLGQAAGSEITDRNANGQDPAEKPLADIPSAVRAEGPQPRDLAPALTTLVTQGDQTLDHATSVAEEGFDQGGFLLPAVARVGQVSEGIERTAPAMPLANLHATSEPELRPLPPDPSVDIEPIAPLPHASRGDSAIRFYGPIFSP